MYIYKHPDQNNWYIARYKGIYICSARTRYEAIVLACKEIIIRKALKEREDRLLK